MSSQWIQTRLNRVESLKHKLLEFIYTNQSIGFDLNAVRVAIDETIAEVKRLSNENDLLKMQISELKEKIAKHNTPPEKTNK